MLHRSSWWIVGVAYLVCAISILVEVAPADGWTSALAALTGATAYIMISVNLLLAVRRPFLERHFGPLDRIYIAHRVIGTAILAVIGLHLILIPGASAVDRGRSLLEAPSVALPLGVLGMVVVGSIIAALSTRLAYGR